MAARVRTDRIESIGIDGAGSLWVKPATANFRYIHREAMAVRWDGARQCLYSPKPRDGTYLAWFGQIRNAAREQGVELRVSPLTVWSNVAADMRRAMTDAVLDA